MRGSPTWPTTRAPASFTQGVVIGVGPDLPEAPRISRGMAWVAVGLHVRPGHSGGPLVDSRGRLVGINTIMAGPEVGLAVPSHVAKVFLRDAADARGRNTVRVA